jgi:hypothetical protein
MSEFVNKVIKPFGTLDEESRVVYIKLIRKGTIT